jgi:hypothetical protein
VMFHLLTTASPHSPECTRFSWRTRSDLNDS